MAEYNKLEIKNLINVSKKTCQRLSNWNQFEEYQNIDQKNDQTNEFIQSCIFIRPYLQFKLFKYEEYESIINKNEFYTIEFTEIKFKEYEKNLLPQNITKMNLDYSNKLSDLIKFDKNDLIDEFELIYTILVIGQIFELFYLWKRIVILFCNSDDIIKTKSKLYVNFIEILIFHLEEQSFNDILCEYKPKYKLGKHQNFLFDAIQVYGL